MKKNRYIIMLGAALLAAASLGMTSLAAGRAKDSGSAETGGPGVAAVQLSDAAVKQLSDAAAKQPSDAAVKDGEKIPGGPEDVQGADQLVAVVGTGGCHADVSYYKKAGDGSWALSWKEAGIVGKNGIAWDKKEGDGKTPAGTYRFTLPFGLKEDPGASLPYHQLVRGDFWVDDPASAHYNQLVNTGDTARDWTSAENLPASHPVYNYALATSYNEECVPGKGSAIFLHCLTAHPDKGSAGCIRLPEERVRELVRSVTENTRLVIVPAP